MKLINLTIVSLITIIFIGGCIQNQEIRFEVFDQALDKVGTANCSVTIPLDDDEACEVAKAAAQIHGPPDFECTTISRAIENQIGVAYEFDVGYAYVASINEDLKTISFYNSP